MKEEWKPIAGFKGYYEVSNKGQVRSLDRFVKRKGKRCLFIKGQIMKLRLTLDGYRKVFLSKDGQYKTITIHRLVSIQFIDNPDNLKEVNHKDGDKTNNRVDNLEWSTRKRNMRHAHKMGLMNMPNGESHFRTTLNELQVRVIRRLECELHQTEIGRIFRVSSSTIGRIHKRKSWTHLK